MAKRIPEDPPEDMPVESLWNISEVSGAWLRTLGIGTRGDLARADIIDVWRELKREHRQVTRLMYYAL